ncbi:MAG: glycosyltransferase [Marinobacter sp.]|uniref:glycosyltransferase n=1 Tax=Marinobacter sp. TaxID=50741 RepID=UPI003F98F8FD
MRILCVIDSLGSGGAQRQLVNLAIAFKAEGHDVEFLVYHSQPFFYEELERHDIRVMEVLESNYLKRVIKMRSVIRSGGYDSVLSFLEAASFICTLAGFPFRRWRLVVGERSANPSILTSFKLRFYRFFHLFVDAVVANSHANLNMIKEANPLIPRKKLKVLYNLIDFDRFEFKEDGYIFRRSGKFNLLVVASHQHLKNLSGLVEAVNLLSADEKSQLIVNWYGGDRSDNSKREAMEKIEEYGLNDLFFFHHPTSKIEEKVNQADALGLFSFYEGFPNVVCEAMANSKPVISSNVSDVSLFLGPEYTFSPHDSSSLSDILKRVLAMDKEELESAGRKNLEVARYSFEPEKIVKSYLSLLAGQ